MLYSKLELDAHFLCHAVAKLTGIDAVLITEILISEVESHLIISKWAQRTLEHETRYTVEQVRALGARRSGRDQKAVDETLAALLAAARTQDANLVPPLLEAARAEATLGEICGALRDEWGAYTEPAGF